MTNRPAKYIILLITMLMLSVADVDGARPKKSKSKGKSKPAATATTGESSASVRNLKSENEKQMRQTDQQIKANTAKVNSQLNRLNLLRGQITACNDTISTLNTTIDSINRQVAAINDTLTLLDERLELLRAAFAQSLRNARQARSSTSKLSLIFASESFSQAFRRLRAVEQFGRWRGRRANEIQAVKDSMAYRRAQLDTLNIALRQSQSSVANRRAQLKTRRDSADKVVAGLRGKDKELRQLLKEQQAKARQLDQQLNRIIAEEQRRAAEEEKRRAAEAERARREAEAAQAKSAQPATSVSDSGTKSSSPNKSGKNNSASKPAKSDSPTLPSSSTVGNTFASSRGSLPAPVDGRYTVVKPFGLQRHPIYNNIETDNAGIDIETSRGATVRAVYDGTVTAIVCPDEVTHVVVIRHGDYVTVYANLGSINVAKGDKVKRGQALGTVYIDSADDNRSILHFEIRNGANPKNIKKENPSQWIRRG